MVLAERLALLQHLKKALEKYDDAFKAVVQKSYIYNKWFTVENTQKALHHICTSYLDELSLKDWLEGYDCATEKSPKKIGIIMAGDIPLAGFHDLLCVFLSGNTAKIKLSERDKFLIPHCVSIMQAEDSRVGEYVEFVERLKGFDAIIATGENSNTRYLKTYFGKYPNIIRESLNSVAVLTGTETQVELRALGENIFRYFGLGSRNVSKLYVPENYNFEPLLEVLHEHKDLVLHDKYKNNFDYNYTLIILNNIPYHANGCMLLTENKVIPSRIAQLHFEYYKNPENLVAALQDRKSEIQAIVASKEYGGLDTIRFAENNIPELGDYFGHVDTMAFLENVRAEVNSIET